MKPHPRIRKTIKWGGASLMLLVTVVWLISGWIAVGYATSRGDAFQVTGGEVGIFYRLAPGVSALAPGWSCMGTPPNWGWTISSFKNSVGGTIWIPLWPAVLTFLLITASASLFDTLARRRIQLNLCPNCNYDRTGLAKDAKCPECGAAA